MKWQYGPAPKDRPVMLWNRIGRYPIASWFRDGEWCSCSDNGSLAGSIEPGLWTEIDPPPAPLKWEATKQESNTVWDARDSDGSVVYRIGRVIRFDQPRWEIFRGNTSELPPVTDDVDVTKAFLDKAYINSLESRASMSRERRQGDDQ